MKKKRGRRKKVLSRSAIEHFYYGCNNSVRETAKVLGVSPVVLLRCMRETGIKAKRMIWVKP